MELIKVSRFYDMDKYRVSGDKSANYVDKFMDKWRKLC
jgi:hypothetical protein